MKTIQTAKKTQLLVAFVAAITLGNIAWAQENLMQTFKLTGQVLDVDDDSILLQSGKSTTEIARDPDTKTLGKIQKGATVTINYMTIRMATLIDARPAAK